MLKRLLNNFITKKRFFQIGSMFTLLLILTASCGKDDDNYTLETNSTPKVLDVNVAFNGDVKPSEGDELVVNLFFGDVGGTAIENLVPDVTKVIPLTQTEIQYGVSISFEDLGTKETIYVNAQVDIDKDGEIGPGDLAVFFNNQTFENVSNGEVSLENIAGKDFVTVNMEVLVPEVKPVNITFSGETKPNVGDQLKLGLFYDEVIGNTTEALFPADTIQVVLDQEQIDNGVSVTFEDFNINESAFVNAHVDINNDGEINAGDLGEFYNDKSFKVILEKTEFPDDVSGEEIVNMNLDMVIELEEEEVPETITDIDGNVYTVVTIGNQVWLAENFRATRYRNGDPIATGLGNEEWKNATEGAYGVYPYELVEGIDSEEEMIEEYGLLYNGFAVTDERNLAPEGWRVATDADWQELESYIGVLAGKLNSRGFRGEVAGTLKTPEAGGSNNFGLSIQLAGLRQKNGNYEKQGHAASLWSYIYKNGSPDEAVRRWMQNGKNGIHRGGRPAQEGLAVRLIKID